MRKKERFVLGKRTFRSQKSKHFVLRIIYALKIIAKQCNITTKLSFHVGRHIFASELCLSQGVPIESVSRMMGHKNIQTTQRYARVNNEKIGNDMKLLSLRISDKYTYVEQ